MARSKPTDSSAPSGKAGRAPKDGGRGRSSGSGAEPVKLNRKGKPKKQRLKKLAGPLVRSSYRAGRLYQQAIESRGLAHQS